MDSCLVGRYVVAQLVLVIGLDGEIVLQLAAAEGYGIAEGVDGSASGKAFGYFVHHIVPKVLMHNVVDALIANDGKPMVFCCEEEEHTVSQFGILHAQNIEGFDGILVGILGMF